MALRSGTTHATPPTAPPRMRGACHCAEVPQHRVPRHSKIVHLLSPTSTFLAGHLRREEQGNAHHSLKLPVCSCVSITLPASIGRRSREVQRVPQRRCLKEKREHHCHPTAHAPSRASLSSDRPRSVFWVLLKKVKTILVHCAHRLLSKLARILCTLRTRPCACASR
jgi:hypothetical protein